MQDTIYTKDSHNNDIIKYVYSKKYKCYIVHEYEYCNKKWDISADYQPLYSITTKKDLLRWIGTWNEELITEEEAILWTIE
jgi:hypothetical protein